MNVDRATRWPRRQTPARAILIAAAIGAFLMASSVARAALPGSLDLSFGSGGIVTVDIGNTESTRGTDLVRQPDGRLVIAEQGLGLQDFAVARLNLDGSLDPTFGDAGEVIIPGDGMEEAYDVALEPSGKILVAGSSFWPVSGGVLARLNGDGSIDMSFGGDGRVSIDGSVSGVSVQPDGRILFAGGPDDGEFQITRLKGDGSVDDSFGVNGTASVGFAGSYSYAATLLVQPDGKILAGGYTTPDAEAGSDFALARLTANGLVDSSFGSGSLVSLDFGDNDAVLDLGLYPDGRILAGGYSSVALALARINGDGTPDASFGTVGRAMPFGDTRLDPSAIALLDNGRILFAGGTDIRVGRVLDNGAPDDSFTLSGLTDVPPVGGYRWLVATSILETGAGEIIFSATASKDGASEAAVLRLTGGAVITPETTIVQRPPESAVTSEAYFKYQATETESLLGFECKLDNQPFVGCSRDGVGYTGLADGGHTFQVRAVDLFGRASQVPAQHGWNVRKTVPFESPPVLNRACVVAKRGLKYARKAAAVLHAELKDVNRKIRRTENHSRRIKLRRTARRLTSRLAAKRRLASAHRRAAIKAC